MLESRSAYGYYGVAGGVTGETRPSELDYTITRMPYWKYKKRYSDCQTVSGSYDKNDKTIEVYIPTETIKPSGMRGQNTAIERIDENVSDKTDSKTTSNLVLAKRGRSAV